MGFSLVAESRGYLLGAVGFPGFSLHWLPLLWATHSKGRGASIIEAHGLKSCGSRLLEHRLKDWTHVSRIVRLILTTETLGKPLICGILSYLNSVYLFTSTDEEKIYNIVLVQRSLIHW